MIMTAQNCIKFAKKMHFSLELCCRETSRYFLFWTLFQALWTDLNSLWSSLMWHLVLVMS